MAEHKEVSLNFRNPSQVSVEYSKTFPLHTTVLQIKIAVSKSYPGGPNAAALILIYAGRVLKDSDVLQDIFSQRDVSLPQTFHLIVKSSDPQTHHRSSSQRATTATPSSAAGSSARSASAGASSTTSQPQAPGVGSGNDASGSDPLPTPDHAAPPGSQVVYNHPFAQNQQQQANTVASTQYLQQLVTYYQMQGVPPHLAVLYAQQQFHQSQQYYQQQHAMWHEQGRGAGGPTGFYQHPPGPGHPAGHHGAMPIPGQGPPLWGQPPHQQPAQGPGQHPPPAAAPAPPGPAQAAAPAAQQHQPVRRGAHLRVNFNFSQRRAAGRQPLPQQPQSDAPDANNGAENEHENVGASSAAPTRSPTPPDPSASVNSDAGGSSGGPLSESRQPHQQHARPNIVIRVYQELETFVVGFLSSLFPSWRMPEPMRYIPPPEPADVGAAGAGVQ